MAKNPPPTPNIPVIVPIIKEIAIKTRGGMFFSLASWIGPSNIDVPAAIKISANP